MIIRTVNGAMTSTDFEYLVEQIQNRVDPPGISETFHIPPKHVLSVTKAVLEYLGIDVTA